MSKFRILRVDDYDPVQVGKRNRLLYTIFTIIPSLFILSINLFDTEKISFTIRLFISLPVLIIFSILILRKVRSDINKAKSIGEIEITQSGFKKRIGDSLTEYNYQFVKELTLTKHMPATRTKESKSRYFSYILKIILADNTEESMVVSDRSVDHNQKISILETIKTLKKIVNFEVKIDC